MISSFANYVREGLMLGVGMDPISAGAGGAITYEGFAHEMTRKPGQLLGDVPVLSAKTGWAKAGAIGFSALGFGGTLYNMYDGYNENGISGVKDAAVWEMATTASIARFAYGSVGTAGPNMMGKGFANKAAALGIKTAGSTIKFGGGAGMGVGLARGAGAAVGASIGQAVLGTPGAFLGAYAGAAPGRFAMTHPLLAGGMVAGAAAAAVGYGAYSMIKTGVNAGIEHRQRQRGIDTAGSMAAFMTGGAQTARSRAVQAIHKSHLNARSALGQEAGFMHSPSRNYHSRYR